ncbi:hypothetical protein EI555_017768 [Monodon monoceros]|uniref:Osteocalcin n=1 Tax=Monodon monoceros TaxID=40151 RepID=A0A4U1EAZ3_MONMO|nr:hypothetical protein EI555_017768 [Monodon monoceros]
MSRGELGSFFLQMQSPEMRSLAKVQQEGSEVVKRLRRYLDHGLGAPAPYPDPLEPRREVCELNPACDELADHIGFQEAYRRLYGTA